MFILPDIIKLEKDDLGIYTPLKGSRWIESQKIASETIKSLAIIGGQWPHTSYMFPGGVMSDPSRMDLINMQNYLHGAITFFEKSLVNMDLENYLSLSDLEQIDKIGGDLGYFRDLSFKFSLEKYGKSYNRFISLAETSSFKTGKMKQRVVHKLDLNKIQETDEFTFSVNEEKKRGVYLGKKCNLRWKLF